MCDSFGIMQLWGKPWKNGNTVRSGRAGLKPRGGTVFVLLLFARECWQGGGRFPLSWMVMLTGSLGDRVNRVLFLIYTPVFTDKLNNRENYHLA